MCKLCVYKSFNHALLESKISGTISFAQWWVLDLTLETLGRDPIWQPGWRGRDPVCSPRLRVV
jgi:hypothetical protein